MTQSPIRYVSTLALAALLVAPLAGCETEPAGRFADPGADRASDAGEIFDAEHLMDWEVYNPNMAYMTLVQDGFGGRKLQISPKPETGWYQQDEAVHISEIVSGNVRVTTEVHVTLSSANYSIGGLLLRDPETSDGGPNTVHVGIGRMGPNDGKVAWVSKNTKDGASEIDKASWSGQNAQLRLCRVDETVMTLIRASEEEEWTMLEEYTRHELGDELAVGPMAYRYTRGNPDEEFSAYTKWVEIAPADSLDDCDLD